MNATQNVVPGNPGSQTVTSAALRSSISKGLSAKDDPLLKEFSKNFYT
jgi:hypothetical protein